MKALVDKDMCIGCGNCASKCPRVFKIGKDGKAEAIVGEIHEEFRKCTEEAESDCPAEAITIEK